MLSKNSFFLLLILSLTMKILGHTTALEWLVATHKRKALGVLYNDIQSKKKKMQMYKKEVEEARLRVLKGEKIQAPKLIVFKTQTTCSDDIGTITKLSSEESRQNILEDIMYNSHKTEDILTKTENELDDYHKRAQENIKLTYEKFLHCSKNANTLKEIEDCQEVFKGSYIPVIFYEYVSGEDGGCDERVYLDFIPDPKNIHFSMQWLDFISAEEVVVAKKGDADSNKA